MTKHRFNLPESDSLRIIIALIFQMSLTFFTLLWMQRWSARAWMNYHPLAICKQTRTSWRCWNSYNASSKNHIGDNATNFLYCHLRRYLSFSLNLKMIQKGARVCLNDICHGMMDNFSEMFYLLYCS